MRRAGPAALAANPVLIGGATVLAIVVAVFLAYNANRVLPFVATYDLRAELPDAAELVRGDDVRLGGSRVGVVARMTPVRHPGGRVTAQLDLKLDPRIAPLPADSTVLVRPQSLLGIKYLEIAPGHDRATLPSGSTLPLSHATPQPVDLDQVLRTFDPRTRRAGRTDLVQLGDALAGRGEDLNRALRDLPPFLGALGPAMRTLAAPGADLAGLVRQAGRAAAALAPVAHAQAALVAHLDATFSALARAARPALQDAISRAPGTLAAGLRTLPGDRPFLANTRRLFAELAPGARALRSAAPDLAAALGAGVPALRRSPELDRRLGTTFAAVRRFAADPRTPSGLAALARTVATLRPTVHFLTPAQTVCNYVALDFRNAASLLSQGVGEGTWQRFSIVAAPPGRDSELGPSARPADDPHGERLHRDPYPNTAAPGEPRECEAGNEPFLAGRQVIGNVPGTQPAHTEATR